MHALQNHDELTYELVHWATGHQNDVYTYKGEEITGAELAETDPRRPDRAPHRRPTRPYNLIFTTNGIACTTATIIAAVLGFTDLDAIDDGPDRDRIRRAHLLLAMFNALQPGVFALSGWDLCGMLTLARDEVAELLEGGDTRWIHRAAHDLMGVAPRATRVDGGHAARPQPLRLHPRAARRRDQLRAPAPGDPAPCAATTASPPARRSTSPTSPTRPCSCWSTSSTTPGSSS